MVALATHSQAHAILDTARNIHRHGSLLPNSTVTLASPALATSWDGDTLTTACAAGAGHLEAALHEMHPGTSTLAALTRAPLLALLQTTTLARLTLNQGRNVNLFCAALGGIHEGNVGLHLDVLANQNLLLERRLPTTSSSPRVATTKSTEQILEVEVCAETSLGTAEASKPTSGKRVSAWATGACTGVKAAVLIKSRRAISIVGFLLLRVGQRFVSSLGLVELFLCVGLLVGVWVVLFGETIVGLFYLGGRGGFVDAERGVWVLCRVGGCGCVE